MDPMDHRRAEHSGSWADRTDDPHLDHRPRRGPPPGAEAAADANLRLSPHLHLVVVDGAWYEDGGELAWEGLGHLGTSEVAAIESGRRTHAV